MASNNRSLALISSILHSPTPLPSVQRLRFTWSKRGPGQSSLRHFLRLRLPVVQFHNPDVRVEFDLRVEETVRAAIQVTTVHGVATLYPADIGVDSDIMDRLVQVGQAQSEAALQAAAAAATRPFLPETPTQPTLPHSSDSSSSPTSHATQ